MANVSRRDVLRYSAARATTVATAAVAVQVLTAAGSAAGPQQVADPDPRDFDEVYNKKKITAKHGRGVSGKHDLKINGKKLAVSTITTLFVPQEGSPPYVAVGLISAINHYDPVEFDDGKHKDGLKKLAKKVVDILGEHAELSDEAAQDHHH